jgi:membrane protease YdiL (CAAX protease family)
VRQRIRKYAIFEPLAIFGMTMAYIWDLRYRHPLALLGILALILLSHALRGERPAKLGFRSANLAFCVRDYAPILALACLALLGLGIMLRTTRPLPLDQCLAAWVAYIPWAMFQQYLLNGYFLNRLVGTLPRRAAPAIAALLFACAHTPNWFLMAVTLLSGYYCARIYQRYRNLYFLGIAHATLGFLLFLVVPDSISHHLIVGPGWFRS